MADNDFSDSLNITQNIKFQMLQAQQSCDGKAGGIGAILRMAGISVAHGLLSIYCALTDQSTPKITGGIFSQPKNHAKECANLENKLEKALQRWITRVAYTHMLANRLQLTRFATVFIHNNEDGGGRYVVKTQEDENNLAENGGIGRSNFERLDFLNESIVICDLFLKSGIAIDNKVFLPGKTSDAERRLEWVRPKFLTLANGTTIDANDIKKRFDNIFKQMDEIDTRINAICVQRELSNPEKAAADSFVQAELTRKLEIITEEFKKAEAFFKGENAQIIVGDQNITSNFLNTQKALDFIGHQKEIATQRFSQSFS